MPSMDRPIYKLECTECKGAVEATFPEPRVHNDVDMISVGIVLPSVECPHCHKVQFKLSISGMAMTGASRDLLVMQTVWVACPVSPKLVGATQLPPSLTLPPGKKQRPF
jgi:hypothetical protein